MATPTPARARAHHRGRWRPSSSWSTADRRRSGRIGSSRRRDKFKPQAGPRPRRAAPASSSPRAWRRAAGSPPKDPLNQAVTIIRSRVDGFGVAESEVTTAGRPTSSSRSPASRTRTSSRPSAADRPAAASGRCWLAGAGAATPQPTAVPDARRPAAARHPARRPRPSGTTSPPASATPSPTTSSNDAVVRQRRCAGDHHPAARRPHRPRRPPRAPGAQPVGRRRQRSPPRWPSEFAQLDCTDPEAVRQELRKPGADRPEQAAGDLFATTASRSTSSARPRSSAPTSRAPAPAWRPTTRA